MGNFEKIVTPHIPKLRRYARALTNDSLAADDLVQDCLERSFDRFHLWQQGSNIKAWLFTIMHNIFVNTVRKNSNTPKIVSLDTDPTLPISKQDNPADSIAMRDLYNALEKLSPDQKQVLVLVSLEGMGYQEVSKILEIPIGTVMSRLHRSRENLRQIMFGSKTDKIGKVS